MKKREFSYGAVFLIGLIFSILGFIINMLFTGSAMPDPNTVNTAADAAKSTGQTSLISTIISGIVAWFGQFIIASGLINNRRGTVGDYFGQVKRINGKVFVVNLLIVLITSLITLAFGGISFLSLSVENPGALLSTALVGFVISLIFGLLVAYANHVLADPRNRNMGVGESIKKIFTVGGRLIGKTILVYLKFFILPLVVIILIGVVGISFISKSPETIFGLSFIAFGIAGIYAILITPFISARISDNYLNLEGEIDSRDDIFIEGSNNDFTMTR